MSIKDEIKNIEIESKNKIIEKLSDAFDVNYDVSQIRIETMQEFNEYLLRPFKQGAEIYYRGERINSKTRKLLPTFLRSDEITSYYNEKVVTDITTDFVMDFYNSKPQFISVYNAIYSDYKERNMYNMLAFAQHYLDISPFIDFTKSLYVALSFAIKGRDTFEDDIVVYTAFDIGFDDTSSDIDEVNSWLQNYSVQLVNTENLDKSLAYELKKYAGKNSLLSTTEHRIYQGILGSIANKVSPVAKLIDISTNDLMKYQQGVFLFLNDFSLVDSNYLTKTVRQSFIINKNIISASLLPEIKQLIINDAPQYRYDYLMNISKAVQGR